MRRLIALLVCAPVSVVGILIAHQAGYALVASDPQARTDLLRDTGHGYFAHLPLVVAVLVALMLCSVAADVVRAVRGRAASEVRLWHFAAFAPAGFVVQEHLERIVHDGAFPVDAWHQPTLLVGVLLQLPVAAFSWLVALAFVRVAPCVQAIVASRRTPLRQVSVGHRPCWVRRDVMRPRFPILAMCAAGRAPPASV